MFKIGRQRSADPGIPSLNPSDSDTEGDPNTNSKPARTSSVPVPIKQNHKATGSGYNEDVGGGASSSSSSYFSGGKKQYKNDFRDSGGIENQTTQELENYAVYKAEEVTKDISTCLKIAEDIREEASNTLVTLHQQGEQITRTHMAAANMEHDLSVGEKLLGSLGGIFSKTWKPKKTKAIAGPVITRDDSFKRKGNNLQQKERQGLMSNQKKQSKSLEKPVVEPSNALEKVEVEKAKQDDALSDLSNVLDQLKGMAVGMGSEIERQNKALDHLNVDVEELNHRVKGANERGRRLLGK